MITALVASEWTKLRSVRSTYRTLAAGAAATIGTAIMVCNLIAGYWAKLDAAQRASFDPLSSTFDGFALGQLAIGALGVLTISAEHSTGLIRTSFAAAPQRRLLLAAKMIVLAATAAVAGALIAFGSFFAGQLMFRSRHLDVGLGHPRVLGAVLAAGAYLPIVALVGLGVGTLIRHTADALATLFALLFLLPQVVNALPAPWDTRIGGYLMMTAAQQMTSLHPDPKLLTPGSSLLVLCAWTAVALTAAAWQITNRDA